MLDKKILEMIEKHGHLFVMETWIKTYNEMVDEGICELDTEYLEYLKNAYQVMIQLELGTIYIDGDTASC